MSRLERRVAFVTGAARGQGRSHALRLAEEGADIIALDVCHDIPTSSIPLASDEDLAQTVEEVHQLGRRIVAIDADVRDESALHEAVARGTSELGPINIVVANAGIISYGTTMDLEAQAFQDLIDVNLIGVWKTCKAAIPSMVSAKNGGSIILISSTAGLKGAAGVAHYIAAKHGVIGIMKSLAIELGSQFIRVNAICPTNTNTGMFYSEETMRRFLPNSSHPTKTDLNAAATALHLLPVPCVEPRDISNAIVFLASDDSRFITGITLPVDAGFMLK